jgi:hypothetical protein
VGEWTRIDTQNQKPGPSSEDSSLETTAELTGKRERPMAVAAVAAYQWLKAALFAQLFWNLWSPSDPSAASAVRSSGFSQNHAVFLLLTVALYLVVLGWELWTLQKWALLLLVIMWLPDLAYDIRPESFGLLHSADLWLGDQPLFLFLGITIGDAIAFTFFLNRKIYSAFNAENETELLEMFRWIFWWT